jgi:hypothetical protein
MYRNKNRDKTRIEYDINVYVREEYNRDTGESYWNENQWYLHVFDYNSGCVAEVSQPFLLTNEESFAMNFIERDEVDGSLDTWMTMDYIMENYRPVMSDRILEYLEGFPKYYEDVKEKVIYN